jgi:hypothetical protein
LADGKRQTEIAGEMKTDRIAVGRLIKALEVQYASAA